MKKNVTISIDEELLEKVRDTVAYLPQWTISHIFAEGAQQVVIEIEDIYGKEVPKRKRSVKRGRRPDAVS